MDIGCRSSRSGGFHLTITATRTYIDSFTNGLTAPTLIEVSGFYSICVDILLLLSKTTSSNNSHNMTLPLQDHTTEAARRDSGTTKAVDGSASSKYIKWYSNLPYHSLDESLT